MAGWGVGFGIPAGGLETLESGFEGFGGADSVEGVDGKAANVVAWVAHGLGELGNGVGGVGTQSREGEGGVSADVVAFVKTIEGAEKVLDAAAGEGAAGVDSGPEGVFMVMEYVEGRTLAAMMRRVVAQGETIPMPIAHSNIP